MYKQIFSILIILLLISSFSIASDLSLEGQSDWTMYQYNAQHTGYNDKDSITVPLQLLWKKNYFPVSHWVNPITSVGDRIIVTSDYSYSYQIEAPPTVRCINVNSGEIIWESAFTYQEIWFMDQASYYNDNIYVMERGSSVDSTRIAKYDLETGTPLTWFMYPDQRDDQLGNIIYDGKLIFPAGYYNGVFCVDLAVDSFLWWNDLPQIDLWSPTAYDSVVYSWTEDLIAAHHLTKGGYLWWMIPQQYDTARYPTNNSEINSVYDFKEFPLKYSLSEFESQGPPFNWSGQNTAAVIDTTIDMIFSFNHDGFYAVNYETKRRIWKKDFDYSIFIILNTPTVCDGKVYNIFLDTLVAMDGLTGTELWKYPLDTLTAYSTAIANRLIFASTQNKTIALDLETQEKVWEYPAGGYLTIANNKLFIASITGDVYAFGRIPTDINDNISNKLPIGFELYQNYPNPFNPSTEISFSLPQKSNVTIDIINIAGQKVRTLTNQIYSAGNHTVTWNSEDDNGNQLSSGIYLYTLETEQYKSSKKMILLK